MKNKILEILNNTLPENVWKFVDQRNSSLLGEYIIIAFAASEINIHNVQGQKPQIVSLSLNLKSLELQPQVFGGNGGQHIYRKPNLNDSKEKYLAMKSVKIPFKRPKPEEKFILNAVQRFAENWVKALKENRDVLMYQDIVNYDEVLK